MMMRISILLVVFIAVCNCEDKAETVAETKSDEHNIINCIDPTKRKVLLASIPVSVSGSLQHVTRKTVIFPLQGINDKKITCYKILDHAQNGRGAYPRIISGGLLEYAVTIEFVSQKSRGITHSVSIYTDA